MADRYQQFISSPLGRQIAKRLGLPRPVPLRRYRPGDPVVAGPVLFDAAPGSRLREAVNKTLKSVNAQVHQTPVEGARYAGLVFDATGIGDSSQLKADRKSVV